MVIQKPEIGRVIAVLLLAVALLAALQRDEPLRVVVATGTPVAAMPTPPSAMTFIAPSAVPTSRATPNLALHLIYGPAAEIRNEVRPNTDVPTRLTDLRAVLLWFFAYDCPPCQPVLSTIDGWYDAYRQQGLSVIGVHYLRNHAERDTDNLVEARAAGACRTRSCRTTMG
ncbi:MAG: hypothetical protein U0703_29610 [Anaerolineae bacterium]